MRKHTLILAAVAGLAVLAAAAGAAQSGWETSATGNPSRPRTFARP